MRFQELFSDTVLEQQRREQFRMRRLQVYNWGTFSGLHSIDIAEQGYLFTGKSGSGKSTLLDAIAAVLIPPRWAKFNVAAQEGERNRQDRNNVSYVRGAWADQSESGSGEIATRYLRPNTTWSALGLEFVNGEGRIVTLLRIFWIKGNGTATDDLSEHFLIAERRFDIDRELEGFEPDRRKLKQRLEGDTHPTNFKAYSERFRHLVGIESEYALKLLQKTQSAKSLGDLNGFLREFMLDRPQTFAVAEDLVREFGELDAAHQQVVTARQQVETLLPARGDYDERESVNGEIARREELLAGLDDYTDQRRRALLQDAIAEKEVTRQSLDDRIAQQESLRDNKNAELRQLRQRHSDLGGDQIVQVEQELRETEKRRGQCQGKLAVAQRACDQLGWTFSATPEGFAELRGRAQELADNWQRDQENYQQHRDRLRDEINDKGRTLADVAGEVQALERQPSNIPNRMLQLRDSMAADLGLSESELPFVGELLQVKESEADWSGAIERLLHGFALSILVEERNYNAVSDYVNSNRFPGQRLVYYRVAEPAALRNDFIGSDSVVEKLDIKSCIYSDWLHAELRKRFDYVCVDSLRAFRSESRAITREGQIRHNRSRHEKDDRRRIDDRRNWVLGFDNREKLALFRDEAQELGDAIAALQEEFKQLEARQADRQQHLQASSTLINCRFDEIDIGPLLDRIQQLSNSLEELREGNSALRELDQKIAALQEKIDTLGKELDSQRAELLSLDRELNGLRKRLEEIAGQVSELTPAQQQGLDEAFAASDSALSLEKLDRVRSSVERAIAKERERLRDSAAELKSRIEKQFIAFRNAWPQECAELEAVLACANEFFEKLKRLQADGLPAYEQRFFNLLQKQSFDNLTRLQQYLLQARREIRERMELVNESLANAEFNTGTHLEIDVKDRHIPSVTEFGQQINRALANSLDTELDREAAEERFGALRQLVDKLGGEEPDLKRWREQVLDVRQQVEFVGRERDADGEEVEVYRGSGGKSGGQRQKLTTTCLAAALRYQLGGSDGGLPAYGAVVMDEAFDKADNEFTELAVNIFTNFGFQMILATPLKSVMTLEPFIGGACFVSIADRQRSSHLAIDYDEEGRQLKLPGRLQEQARDETEADPN